MKYMFFMTKAFNQPLNSWKTSIPVHKLRGMFAGSACEFTHGLAFIIVRHTTNE